MKNLVNEIEYRVFYNKKLYKEKLSESESILEYWENEFFW